MSVPPVERFGPRAAVYAKARPGYPAPLIGLLLRETPLTASSLVADIGSGTGFSARPFVELGFQVAAVEPNAEMRAIAEAALGGSPCFRSVSGTAEQTQLDAMSVDLIVAATAFHWFRPDEARAEFRRILRPSGVVALMWNRRAREASAFMAAYDRLLREYCAEYTEGWAQQREDFGGLAGGFLGVGHQEAHFPHEQQMSLESLTARLLSASYAPMPDQPGYQPMMTSLEAMFADHQEDGQVTFHYDACVYWSRGLV
jgi:SAM-dependent methyltransferase